MFKLIISAGVLVGSAFVFTGCKDDGKQVKCVGNGHKCDMNADDGLDQTVGSAGYSLDADTDRANCCAGYHCMMHKVTHKGNIHGKCEKMVENLAELKNLTSSQKDKASVHEEESNFSDDRDFGDDNGLVMRE